MRDLHSPQDFVMLIKTIAIIAFVAIIISLATALYHLVRTKDQEQSRKTAQALTYRIGISLGLFILMAIALMLGLFQPEGIGARIQQIHQQAPSQPNDVKP